MTRRWLMNGLPLTLTLAVAQLAQAHGGEEHVMGTVVSADAKSIVVKSTKGEDTTIQVDGKTKVERSGTEAKVTELAAGERVVVHTRKGEGGLTATMIKAGTSKGSPHKNHDHAH